MCIFPNSIICPHSFLWAVVVCIYIVLRVRDARPYRVGAVLWAMGTYSCDTVSLSSPCHSERRKYPCGMFSSRTLKNLKRILDFLKTKCSAFRESTGERSSPAEIPPSLCYGAASQLDSLRSLRMTRREASSAQTKKAQGYPSRKPFRESLCASFFLLRERLSVFSELFCFYNSILYGFCQVGKNYLGTPKKCKKSKKVLNFIAIYAIILYMRFIFERNDLL